jgi:creatinine amidohydrolase/Fe(II)-dependent formamide hydrolase-like protein
MRYELMLPHQIRKAIAKRWPVVLPLGVLEYHGEHLAVGMDTLAVVKMLEIVAQEIDLVILPPFYYGAASYTVEPPEGNGSLHVAADKLFPFAQELFRGLLRIGFRNLHFFIHHQTENFAAGMPTDLAFKFAARQAIFEFLERERGEGWWGNEKMADYYSRQATGDDPFNWIKGHPLMTPEIIGQYPFDHAGEGETSLMMALCPEAVDMKRHASRKWYTRSARQASPDLGNRGRDLILAQMRIVLDAPPGVDRLEGARPSLYPTSPRPPSGP